MRRSRVAWADAASRVIHFLRRRARLPRRRPFFDDTTTAGITVPSVTGAGGREPARVAVRPHHDAAGVGVFDLAAGFNR